MKKIITDKRYIGYYIFTAIVVATILAVEDLMEGDVDLNWIVFDFITDLPVFTTLAFLISLISYQVIIFLNKRFPWDKAQGKRFMLEIGLMIIMVVTFTRVASFLARNYDLGPREMDGDFGFEIIALIMFFITVFMIFSFHEFMMLSNDKQYLEFRASMLEKQNYLMKYEALKNQINPHFLFNSLNVLSSLIYKDISKSDQFIKKFSEVFRYVLELNQEKLVPIKQELKFLDSYLFLQKIRYGENLEIHKCISSDVLDKYIPPLSLQLVVENAIKHNIISKEQKLIIKLAHENDQLVISNNYQFRSNINGSTGIGQKNLIEKYELIAQKLPEFYVEDEHYFATLPIIEQEIWKEL